MLRYLDTLIKYPKTRKLKNKNSHKFVCVTCDFCGENFEQRYRYYYTGKKEHVCNKTVCTKCRYKKAQITNEGRYGTSNINNIPEVREKIKQTNLEKYGVSHISQTSGYKEAMKEYRDSMTEEDKRAVREKAEATNMERYGVYHPMKDKGVSIKVSESLLAKSDEEKRAAIEKREATQLALYGGNYNSTQECKDKIKNTCIKNHGVPHHFQSKEILDKMKKGNLDKYGVEWATNTPKANEARYLTNLERYGCSNPMQNPEVAAKSKQALIENGKIKLYGGKRIEEWADIADLSRTHAGALLKQYGSEFLSIYNKRITSIEQHVQSILESNFIDFSHGKTLNGRKTDFIIESAKLVIECDSFWWHCDKNRPNKDYHIVKMKDYQNAGYRCLFFREDELVFKPEVVESVILNACKLTPRRAYARSCEIIELDNEKASAFVTANHLMGAGRGRTFALTISGKIVSAIRMVSKGRGTYEISRFCSMNGYNVVGGFSRLLAHAEKELKAVSIITFIDQRYGKGDYLDSLGFTRTSCSPSFRWTNGRLSFHRMTFPGNSGYENGFYKIWDCGQAKFTKKVVLNNAPSV